MRNGKLILAAVGLFGWTLTAPSWGQTQTRPAGEYGPPAAGSGAPGTLAREPGGTRNPGSTTGITGGGTAPRVQSGGAATTAPADGFFARDDSDSNTSANRSARRDASDRYRASEDRRLGYGRDGFSGDDRETDRYEYGYQSDRPYGSAYGSNRDGVTGGYDRSSSWNNRWEPGDRRNRRDDADSGRYGDDRWQSRSRYDNRDDYIYDRGNIRQDSWYGSDPWGSRGGSTFSSRYGSNYNDFRGEYDSVLSPRGSFYSEDLRDRLAFSRERDRYGSGDDNRFSSSGFGRNDSTHFSDRYGRDNRFSDRDSRDSYNRFDRDRWSWYDSYRNDDRRSGSSDFDRDRRYADRWDDEWNNNRSDRYASENGRRNRAFNDENDRDNQWDRDEWQDRDDRFAGRDRNDRDRFDQDRDNDRRGRDDWNDRDDDRRSRDNWSDRDRNTTARDDRNNRDNRNRGTGYSRSSRSNRSNEAQDNRASGGGGISSRD